MIEALPVIFTVLFLLVLLSYYILLFLPRKKPDVEVLFSGITVIIPAHNEEAYLADCIKSVADAEFAGQKEMIVVDDGSVDRTFKIASSFKSVKVIRTKHSGKSASINLALAQAKYDLIAIVDGDSTISRMSLKHMAHEVSKDNTAAACCIIKVKNRKRFLCIWPHIEQLYNSMMRSIMVKVNANVTTPGPLSIYRKKALDEIGGFSTAGFSEDVDITIRLIRKGYNVGFSDKAVAETNMPHDLKGFLRQRFRFARGMLNIFKRHIQLNKAWIDAYTLPLLVFTYMQAVIMGSFTIYQIIYGYFTYYAGKGVYFSLDVLRYFLDWFSIVGFIKWAYGVFTGDTALTLIAAAGIASTLLTYPLYLYSIFKYDRKFDFYHLLPIFFMAPFWWFIMIVYTLSLPEMFSKEQYNRWKKNE